MTSAVQTSMEPDRIAEARGLIERYLDRFNEADFEGALACYFLPFTWFFDPVPFTVATAEQFISAMRTSKAKLVETGLGHTQMTGCGVRLLDRHAALAEVSVSRRRVDGSELEPAGGTYLLLDRGDGWRLASFVEHRPFAGTAGSEP